MRYLPPRRRFWVVLWARLGGSKSPVEVLSSILLICESDLEYERPNGRACAVAYLLRCAARGSQQIGAGRLFTARANAAIGRRVLRALGPLLGAYALHVAERTVGQKHPRRPQYALDLPPRRVRRWSHADQTYRIELVPQSLATRASNAKE
jgi:hypothetical protein